MKIHHYGLIVIAMIAGYALATYWPAPGQMVRSAIGM